MSRPAAAADIVLIIGRQRIALPLADEFNVGPAVGRV